MIRNTIYGFLVAITSGALIASLQPNDRKQPKTETLAIAEIPSVAVQPEPTATPAPPTSQEPHASFINHPCIGVYDRKDSNLVDDIIQSNDRQALYNFLVNGRGYCFQAGTEVTLMDWAWEMRKVRIPGSIEGVWVPSECVTE
jgi:hypothetical protein